MTMIPNCYYDRSITSFIDRLIDDGYTNFDEILDVDKDILISKTINIMGSDAYDFIYDTDFISMFSKHLISNKRDEEHEMIETLKESANKFFSRGISELFQERYEQYSQIMNHEIPVKNWSVRSLGL